MRNPDSWIRKYFAETLNNITVSGKTIPIYDYRAKGNDNAYILMTTQSKEEDYSVKCGMNWNCEITLDVVTIYPGNVGSRKLADDISEAIVNLTDNINVEHFSLVKVSREYPADLSVNTGEQSIFRKIIKYNLKLKENE